MVKLFEHKQTKDLAVELPPKRWAVGSYIEVGNFENPLILRLAMAKRRLTNGMEGLIHRRSRAYQGLADYTELMTRKDFARAYKRLAEERLEKAQLLLFSQ